MLSGLLTRCSSTSAQSPPVALLMSSTAITSGQKTHLTFYNKGDEDVRKPEWLLLAVILPSELTNFTHLIRCQTSSCYFLFFFQPFLGPVCLPGWTVGCSLGHSLETECRYNCNNIFLDVLKLKHVLCDKVTVSCIMPMLADCVDRPC